MSTGTRMLQLLSLLQTHRYWPGQELAERLEVSDRTLRRDVERLRDLGYQVDSVRGTAGGYQLRAGGSLPPLLLDDEEAVAIAVGLRSAAAGAVVDMEESAVRALTKVIALLPPRLRRRMDAIREQTIPGPLHGPRLDAETLTTLAQGCRDDETVRFRYTPRQGDPTDRHVEPHRLVSLGRRWYLVAYDRGRSDWRSFRVDRVTDAELTGQRFLQRELPADDALAFLQASMATMPRRYDVRVRIATSAAQVESVVGHWAELAEDDEGTVMTMQTDDLFWPMAVLSVVDAPFTVESPDELRDQLAAAGRRFTAAAG